MRVRSTIEILGATRIAIGNADPEDAEELLEFLDRVHRQTEFLKRKPEELDLSLEDEKEFIREMNESPHKFYVVARDNDIIVGCLSFISSIHQRYKHQGELRMSVDKSHWGKGIGSSLIKFLIDWGENNKLKRIELRVDAHNVRAINLYRKFGFREEGRLKKRRKMRPGDYHDELVMAYIYR